MPLRVGVFGAGGRMGSTVCEAVADDPDLELVAAVDPFHSGIDLRQVTGVDLPMQVAPGPEVFTEVGAQVVVDFTSVDAARGNVQWLADHGVHAVVGTTGLTEADYAAFRDAFTQSNCVVAPNFAIGAVLMMRFAELAAPFFESVEVIEYHHDQKMSASRLRRGSGERTPPPRRSSRVRAAGGAPPTSGCTRCACGGWWRARRCSSAPPVRRWASATTRSTARRSCPASCSPSRRSAIGRA